MIKNLLDADENPPPGTKVVIEDTTIDEPTATAIGVQEADSVERSSVKTEDIHEITAIADNTQNITQETSRTTADTLNSPPLTEMFVEATSNFQKKEPTLFQTDYKPESQAETMRKSGLAYAAAITLFGAVVFMMVLGWFADLLLGSSPWGIVGGIVLGAIIGFVQFFRLTSQILKNKE